MSCRRRTYKLVGCRLLFLWCVQVHLGDVRLHNSQPLLQLILMCQGLKLSKLSPLYRVWLQHSCCPADHVGLHARYLSDLLQLLPGNLHTHPTAVCGPGSRNPLRRCPPAPHTTGIGHRATAPSSVTVSQAPYMFKNSLC